MPTDLKSRSLLVQRIRAILFAVYGPYCAGCGCDLHGVAWEFNHLWPRDWKPREKDFYGRNLRYFKEAQAGLGDLRCPDCNKEYRPSANPSPRPPADYRCPRFQAWLAAREVEPDPF